MIVGSLFSGVGGFDLGLEQAGHTIAWQCEADAYRRGVLAAHWPGVTCYPDVRGMRRQPHAVAAAATADPLSGWGASDALVGRAGATREQPALDVDLICGGFPCQDLSVAGRRAGLSGGERSSLFFECARVADELLRPGGWILLENVPGLLSSQGGRDFAVLLATLADLGFHDLAWRVLDSRFFGVPQRRRRVFILARRARGERAREVLLEPESSGGDPQAGGEAGQGVAVASLSGLGSGGPDDNDAQGGRLVTEHTTAAMANWGKRFSDPGASRGLPLVVADTLTSGSHPASNMPGRRREDDTNLVASEHVIAKTLKRNHGSSWKGEDHDTYIVSPEVSPPLDRGAGDGPRRNQDAAIMTHGAGVRRLTPRECERLQGFPDDWTLIDDAADSRRYAAMGDAVTVPIAAWIGQRLAFHGGGDG